MVALSENRMRQEAAADAGVATFRKKRKRAQQIWDKAMGGDVLLRWEKVELQRWVDGIPQKPLGG